MKARVEGVWCLSFSFEAGKLCRDGTRYNEINDCKYDDSEEKLASIGGEKHKKNGKDFFKDGK